MRLRALLAAAALLAVPVSFTPAQADDAPYTVTKQFVSVPAGPGSSATIKLWTSVYRPASASPASPVPVVLHTHGWGGRHDKGLELQAAQMLASKGYGVVGWDSRGFGNSEGWVELNSPDYEVRDVSRMLDFAAGLGWVKVDGPNDPRAGMVGGSYAGGIQLLAAAFDRRLDAIVPLITWNDLPRSLAPDGVVKLEWVSLLFGAGVVSGLVGDTPPDPARSHAPDATVSPILVDFFVNGLVQGTLSQQAYDALSYRSPSRYLGAIRTPTLLIQGAGDTLFPWNEAVANYVGISRHAPAKLVQVQWGHSEPAAPGELAFTGTADDVIGSNTLRWFRRWLDGDANVDTGPPVMVRTDWLPTDPANGESAFLAQPEPLRPNRTFALDATTGALRPAPTAAAVARFLQPAAPASYTEFSGFSGAGAPGDRPAIDAPGTYVAFDTPALTAPLDVAGVPHLRFPVTSTTTDTVIYAKLMDVAPDGTARLVRRTVQPVRLQTNPAGAGAVVDMDLIGLAHRFPAGHKVRLVLAATDSAFLNTRQAGVYTVATGGASIAELRLPVLPS